MRKQNILLCLLMALGAYAQSYNSDRVSFTNFLVRMYNDAPFEGVRAVDDYDNAFLISVLALDKTKYTTVSTLNRVASVKAMAQASRYFNGANITQDMIIRTSEKADGSSDTEIIENIRENSVGYVKALEQLTNFTRKDGLQVFIFITPLRNNEKKH
ncbi:MAG: hypothetical protein J1F27_00935 [Prevotellaceae bacterium]|nr:hypothetical protein [Prevotellaceae bacterium]